MKAATAAANVASPGEAVAAARAGAGDFAAGVRDFAAGVRGAPITPIDGGISRAADPDASATPLLTPGTAGVPAAESGTASDRRGARDRVVRRSPGPSVGLMTRAYVSVIASHAAPYRFMPKHQCFMRMVCLKLRPGSARETAQSRPVRSGGPARAVAAGVLRPGQADDQGVAARRATPFPAVAVQYIRAARRPRVKLLEQPLLVASGAVPAQLRHPGDLLGAMGHGACRGLKGLMPIVARSCADSWDLGRRVSRRLPCGDVRRSLT